MLLIVGLGNPGLEYSWTRHNIGMQVVQSLACKRGCSWKREKECLAYISVSDQCIMAYPTVYMNDSGKSVRLLTKKYEVEHLLIVCDDIESSWMDTSVVFAGGARGHNGVKSIHACMQTRDFFLMRMGVGHPGHNVAEYVLDVFSPQEREEMPTLLNKAVIQAEEWMAQFA